MFIVRKGMLKERVEQRHGSVADFISTKRSGRSTVQLNGLRSATTLQRLKLELNAAIDEIDT